MSIEKLTNTIIESAKNKAKEITAQYNQEIQKLKDATNAQIKQLIQEYDDKLAQQQTLIKNQLISNATLKAKQEILKTKWVIIDEIFDQAKEKFIASDTYPNALKDIVTRNADSNSELIVSKSDYTKLQKLLPNVKLTSSDNLTNGLIIKKGRVELNYSLDRIIKSLKSELVIELSKLLFE